MREWGTQSLSLVRALRFSQPEARKNESVEQTSELCDIGKGWTSIL